MYVAVAAMRSHKSQHIYLNRLMSNTSLPRVLETRGSGSLLGVFLMILSWPGISPIPRKVGSLGGTFLLLVAPLHEAFQGIELGQAELVIDLGRVPIAILGALPELAAVHTAGKHGPVFLRLMPKDSVLLAL